MALAFLLDENVRGPLWQAILSHNLYSDHKLSVVRVGDFPDLPLSADDPQVLLWAEREARLLVTADRNSMPSYLKFHLYGGHHSPGILIPHADTGMGELIEFLELISVAGNAFEFADAVTYIP
jgi:Domain of unknown function (DUF5615)